MIELLVTAVVNKHGSIQVQVGNDGIIRVEGETHKIGRSFDFEKALIDLLAEDVK